MSEVPGPSPAEMAPAPQNVVNPQLPMGGRFSEINEMTTKAVRKDGEHVKQLRAVDAQTGKPTPISYAEVAGYYGYELGNDSGKEPTVEAQAEAATEPQTDIIDNAVGNPWTALRNAQEAVNKEEKKNKAEAARWNTWMRPYAARDAVIKKQLADANYELTQEDIDALKNGDLQEQLDKREGKPLPTEDDINYYNLLQEQEAARKLQEQEDAKLQIDDQDLDQDDDTPLPKEMTDEEVINNLDKLGLPEDLGSPEFKALLDKFKKAKSNYAELTAKRRGISTIGYKGKLQKAYEEYIKLETEAGGAVGAFLKAQGASDAELRMFATAGAIVEGHSLAQEVKSYQDQMPNTITKRFAEMWAKGGKVKKGLMIAAIPAAAGFITASMPIGAGVGLVTGMLGGRMASRGMFGAKVDKIAGGKTLAEQQAGIAAGDTRKHAMAEYANAVKEDRAFGLTPEGIASTNETITQNNVGVNRRRMGKTAVTGVLAGVAGGAVHQAINGNLHFFDKHPGPKTGNPTGTPQPPVDPGSGEAFKYPWNWAEKVAGKGKGASALHEAVAKAQADGVKAVWHAGKYGARSIVSVNGNYSTPEVIKELAKYMVVR